MDIIGSLLVSQLTLLIPVVIFLAITKTGPAELIQHKKIRVSTAFMIAGFTLLSMPLILLVNLISLLFVENTVTEAAELFVSAPMIPVVLIVGVLGPASEEFTFRGVLYHSYRRSGRLVGPMLLSAFLFGLTHLNFNQMSYAVVVGILGVLLVECTGSIFSSMIFHMIINLFNVIPMALSPELYADTGSTMEKQLAKMGMTYREYLYMEIGIYGVIALISTALALCLLYAIAQREGRSGYVHALLHRRFLAKKESLISVPLLISVAICFAVMTIDVLINK